MISRGLPTVVYCQASCMHFYVRGVGLMVFNATFSNISAIPWSLVLRKLRYSNQRKPQNTASNWKPLSHKAVQNSPRHKPHNDSGIHKACICECKANCHLITITTAYLYISHRENRRGSQEWTIQRHWQHLGTC